MNLELEKLKSSEVYEKAKPTILLIKEEYNFLADTEEELDLIIKNIINVTVNHLSKTSEKKDTTNLTIFKKILINGLDHYIKENVNDNPFIFQNFLAKKVVFTNDQKSDLQEFKKVLRFIKIYNYTINLDVCVSLIKNNSVINDIIGTIVSENLELIKSDSVFKILHDELFASFIEAYCMINNIEIGSDEAFITESLGNYNIGDSLSLYLRDLDKNILSIDEEREFMRKIKQGDTLAKKTFIERNLRLVVSIAKRYKTNEIPFLDLIQEGNIGLITAVDKFDASMGYKFSTYATWWIKQAIARYIANNCRTVRIPAHMHEKVLKYRRVESELKALLNRDPSREEIANKMGISLTEANKLYAAQTDTLSLNSYIGSEEDTEFGDMIADDAPPVEDTVIEGIYNEKLSKLLHQTLTPREIQIIEMRFGFNDNAPMTLEAVGKTFGLTRERIRQLEARAIRKLRKSKFSKELSTYYRNM